MKILEQYIVFQHGKPQLLVKTENTRWFITDTGAFGQRDMTWSEIYFKEASELIKKSAK